MGQVEANCDPPRFDRLAILKETIAPVRLASQAVIRSFGPAAAPSYFAQWLSLHDCAWKEFRRRANAYSLGREIFGGQITATLLSITWFRNWNRPLTC